MLEEMFEPGHMAHQVGLFNRKLYCLEPEFHLFAYGGLFVCKLVRKEQNRTVYEGFVVLLDNFYGT